jgi:thiol-disulfide isomerase/thioredoxin
MTRSICFFLTLAFTLSPWPALSQVTEQDTIHTLSYELITGKKLSYTARSKFEYSLGLLESKATLEIWVVRKNADGSWQLLLRNTETTARTDESRTRVESTTDTGWAFCALFPDGHFKRNRAMDGISQWDLYLPKIFIPLPDDFSNETITWESGDHPYNEIGRYSAGKPDTTNRSWIVRVTHTTPLDAVYLIEQKAEVYIDMIKMIPVYKKGESKRGHGQYAGHGTYTVLLDSIVELDTLRAKRYLDELMIFFAVDSLYNYIIGRVEENPGQLTSLRKEAEDLLTRAKRRITISEIKTLLANIINGLPGDFEYLAGYIHKRAQFANKPAPNWQARDFSGSTHSFDDYRGKVMLLDFWYRNCPWCIRAMPMIKRLAEHFANRNFSVIGVNTDKERSDAIFVLEKMNLPYINIEGRDLIKHYAVTNYPTFFVIDKDGLVRRILIGYEPLLTEKLIEIIEPLLQ